MGIPHAHHLRAHAAPVNGSGAGDAPRGLARALATAARYVAYGEVSFFVATDLCLVLLPSVAAHHWGLSHFGIRRETVVPYMAGLLLAGCFMFRGGRALPRRVATFRILGRALEILGALVIGVSLTPYSVDAAFDWAHVGTSSVLFFGEMLVAAWLVLAHARDRINILLLIFQVAAGVTAFLSEVGAIDRLLGGELVTQAVFGLILLRSLNRLASPPGVPVVHSAEEGSRMS